LTDRRSCVRIHLSGGGCGEAEVKISRDIETGSYTARSGETDLSPALNAQKETHSY